MVQLAATAHRWVTGLSLGMLLWSTAASSHAQSPEPEPELTWRPELSRFAWYQYAATGAMAGLLTFGRELYEGPDTAQWDDPILFDRPVRIWLSAGSEEGRIQASEISDYLMYALIAYPFLDSVVVAGAAHQNYDVALQMTMISLQATLLQKVLSGLTKNLVRRARPDEQRCEQGDELGCSARARSFFSGHTGTAFAGAGLVCAHHENLPLYGGGGADRAACGIALGAAATVGGLRVVADRHHVTDVMVGALAGLFAGYLVPNLFNYDFGAGNQPGDSAPSQTLGTIAPLADPNTLGVQYLGLF